MASVGTIEHVRAALEEKQKEIVKVQQRMDAAEQEMKAKNVPEEIRIQRLNGLQQEKNTLGQQETALKGDLRTFSSALLSTGFAHESPVIHLCCLRAVSFAPRPFLSDGMFQWSVWSVRRETLLRGPVRRLAWKWM